METTNNGAPEVGSLVRRGGSEIAYRVIERHATGTGCRAEATVSEVTEVAGRQPRKLLAKEKCVSLAFSRSLSAERGRTILVDAEWRGWEVIS